MRVKPFFLPKTHSERGIGRFRGDKKLPFFLSYLPISSVSPYPLLGMAYWLLVTSPAAGDYSSASTADAGAFGSSAMYSTPASISCPPNWSCRSASWASGIMT